MKFFITIFLFFVGLSINANEDVLIFNSTGQVTLVRDYNSISNISGMRLLAGDEVIITSGSFTVLTNSYKRITFDKPGNYAYSTVIDLLKSADASVTNKYFVYVWEKMNANDEAVRHPGGVVRGDEYGLEPWDSAIIISKSITFSFPNQSDSEFDLYIYSKLNTLVFKSVIVDSVEVNLSDLEISDPGYYYWYISSEFGGKPDKRWFEIPENSLKTVLKDEYIKFKDAIKTFSDIDRINLINEYLITNKIYLNDF